MADDLEANERLERIFHPYARRQMDDFAQKQRDPTIASFVHYTSAEAALSILKTKRIWLRNVTGMPDFTEVLQGFNLISDVLFGNDRRGWAELSKALDDCASGSAGEALQFFNKLWNDIRYNTYITSISEHDESEDEHGRLSMWRAFGETNVRVAIVFKFPLSLLRGGVFNLVVSPVAYLKKEEVEEQFRAVVQNIRESRDFLASVGRERIVNWVTNMLVLGVTCLKHEGFREEREWRVIYAPNRWSSELIERSMEVVRGIPQIVYKIPLDAKAPNAPEGLSRLDLAQLFHHLIIGPATYPFSMIDAFGTVLQNAGVSELQKRIVLSGIPIRF